jgi:hypothetical protein
LRVAVLGAGADVGRVISFALAQSDLLTEGDELVLIGRREGKSAFVVRGMAEDFSEAFADKRLRIVPSLTPTTLGAMPSSSSPAPPTPPTSPASFTVSVWRKTIAVSCFT